MYQSYGQQPAPSRVTPNYYQPQIPALKGRPVSSLDEVRATGIDFDGTIFYFPDVANKRIYTKQIGMDGSAVLKMYEERPVPQDVPVGAYITREEFENALRELRQSCLEIVQPSTKESQTSKDDLKAEPPQYNF